MDVARYIGLFLLKNHFCYIHGLGNLEIRKKSASFDGEALQAPSYEVVITPAGSIDDNLANFIATNEQISISKASNALRDYSTWAKAELDESKDVIIPAIGKFSEVEGKIHFTTDPNLQYTPPGIPAMKSARRVEETSTNTFVPPGAQPYQPQTQYTEPGAATGNSGGQLNWGRIIIAGVILLAVVGGSIFAVRYMQNSGKKNPETNANVSLTPPVKVDSTKIAPKDTTATQVDTTAAAAQDGDIKMENGVLKFKLVVNTYESMAAAEKRKKQLKGNGHNPEIISEDSNHAYFVVLPISAAPGDTAHLFDSLKRMLNPKEGVYIY